jgi:phosphatidate cytidylyltransferase
MIDPDQPISLLALVTLILGLMVSIRFNNYLIVALLIAFVVVQAIRWILAQASYRQRLIRVSIYIGLGALYIGVPLSLAIALRNMDRGFEWTVIAFANNWATDGFALIGGRIAGRHKLAPRISPGKTIEGALIGLISGFLLGMFAAAVFRMPVGLSILANVAVAVMTLLGDLLESWIKRMFAVKDAGSLLPGHGGLLDRVDGMLLAVPVLYLILMLR